MSRLIVEAEGIQEWVGEQEPGFVLLVSVLAESGRPVHGLSDANFTVHYIRSPASILALEQLGSGAPIRHPGGWYLLPLLDFDSQVSGRAVFTVAVDTEPGSRQNNHGQTLAVFEIP